MPVSTVRPVLDSFLPGNYHSLSVQQPGPCLALLTVCCVAGKASRPALSPLPSSPLSKFRQVEQGGSAVSLPGSPGPASPGRGTNLWRVSSMPAQPRPTLTRAQLAAGPPQQNTVTAARSGSGAKETITYQKKNYFDVPAMHCDIENSARSDDI